MSRTGHKRHEATPAPADMTPTEATICEIWSDVLGVRVATPREDFFACGGNSVFATQAIARIRRYLGKDVSLAAVMENPVLEDLARHVDQAAAVTLPTISASSYLTPVKASYAQQRLWFTCQLFPQTTAYNLASAYAVTGNIDEHRLRTALEVVAHRQESLRTYFTEIDGTPYIGVRDDADPNLLVRESVGRAELFDVLEKYRAMPFDLETGPLFRAVLLRLGPQESVLLLCGHHIILDGWSEDLLRREISDAYDDPDSVRRTATNAPEISYRDFASWQRTCIENGALEHQREYWRHRLAGAPPELAPASHRARQEATTQVGEALDFDLDAPDASLVRRVADRTGTTPFAVALTAFGLALRQVFEVSEAVVGVPAFGRPLPEVESLVGYFTNSLPLRIELAETADLPQILRNVRARLLEAMANQDLPFDQIVDAVRPVRMADRNPLFQVWFDFFTGRHVLKLGDAKVAQLELPSTTEPFDLSLQIRRTAGGLAGRLTYNPMIVDSGASAEIVSEFVAALRRLATVSIQGRVRVDDGMTRS